MRAALLLALLVALPPLAGAWHDTLPSLASGGAAGGGWVALKLSPGGARMDVELRVEGIHDDTQLGIAVLDATGAPAGQLAFTLVAAPSDEQRASFDLAGHGVEVGVRPSPGEALGSATLKVYLNHIPPTSSSVTTLVLWAAGGVASHAWDVRGAQGSALLGATSGTETFLWMPEDFEGGASVANMDDGVGARADAARTRAVTVDGRLFGSFYHAPMKEAWNGFALVGTGGVAALVAEAPGALPERCAPCVWTSGEPGTYRFYVTAADATTSTYEQRCPTTNRYLCTTVLVWRDAVVAAGADVRLPA